MRSGKLWVGLCLWCCTVAGAAEPNHDVTLDDYTTLVALDQCALAPQGDWVALCELRWQESTDDRLGDLWLVEVATKQHTRLTTDRAGYQALHWSPDGESLFTIAARSLGETAPADARESQVWRIHRSGGEPEQITHQAEGLDAYTLSADGKFLCYVVADDTPSGDFAELIKAYPQPGYGTGRTPRSRIYRHDLTSGAESLVIELPLAIAELSLSPDGTQLALITAPEDRVIRYEGETQVDLVELASGHVTRLPDTRFRQEAPSRYGRLSTLCWSPSGKSLAFVVAMDGYPSEVLLGSNLQGEPQVDRLERPAGVTLTADVEGPTSLAWVAEQDLAFIGQSEARDRIYVARQIAGGHPARSDCLTPGDCTVKHFAWSAAAQVGIAIWGTPESFPDLYLCHEAGEATRLMEVNAQADNWRLPRVSLVEWKGAKGDRVQGVLELPPGTKDGERVPLVVNIHGGPTDAVLYERAFSYFGNTWLSTHGYAVLSPNYRGSTGYGDRFLVDLIGHQNEYDVADILAGVDALVERGIADPDRLGVGGWSNGGYLTNCVISKTNRFKAASSGAGIADATLEWGANDEPAYAMMALGGFPWNRTDEYHRVSPIYHLGDAKTPTLIHVGGGDPRCPVGNSAMIFRALHEYLHVPSQLVVYPYEPHNLTRLSSRRAKMSWDLAWFDRYVKGSKEALPKTTARP